MVLQGNELSNETQRLSIPVLKVDGLFMTQKLSQIPKKLSPLNVTPFNVVTTNGGLMSPESPARSDARSIDPSLVSVITGVIRLYCVLIILLASS